MIELVCLLEEPSAKEMFNGILPRLLPEEIIPRYIVFEGKQDLEKRLVMRLKFWQNPHALFLIMRDKDAGDCLRIKENLTTKVTESGKKEISLVRVACHELESYYLVPKRKRDSFSKFKEEKNFNRRHMIDIPRIKIFF